MTDAERIAQMAMELGRLRAKCAQLEQETSDLRMEVEALKNRRCERCGAAVGG